MPQNIKISTIASSALLAILSLLIPRTPSIWVVGGNKGLRYADNSMYFFKYCASNTNKRMVWLTRSPAVLHEVRSEGHEAHLIQSIRGIWLGLRAKWHTFDVGPGDTGPTCRGALRLNLWHGIPLKDISYLKRKMTPRSWPERIHHWQLRTSTPIHRDYFAHPNTRFLDHILRSFHIEPRNIIIANLPRNEVLKNSQAHAQLVKKHDRHWIEKISLAHASGKAVIGYFPTWRGDGNDQFMGTQTTAEIARIDEFLARHNCVLVTKWHTCSFKEYGHSGQSRTAEQISSAIQTSSNFIELAFETDLNSILPSCDLLVTDYSSVFFDHLFLNKPQIFLPYDLEHYREAFGFFHNYKEIVPGPIVTDVSALLALFEDYCASPAAFSNTFLKERARARSLFFEDERGSEKIVEHMLEIS